MQAKVIEKFHGMAAVEHMINFKVSRNVGITIVIKLNPVFVLKCFQQQKMMPLSSDFDLFKKQFLQKMTRKTVRKMRIFQMIQVKNSKYRHTWVFL